MFPTTGYALLGIAIVLGLFVPALFVYAFMASSLSQVRKRIFSVGDPDGRLVDEAAYRYMISRLGRLHIRLLLIACFIFTICAVTNIVAIGLAANG